MSEQQIGILVIQIGAIVAVLALTALPYFVFDAAKTNLAFCIKIACAEALFLAGWYVFGSAIVAPVSPLIAIQGLTGGVIVAASVFAAWLLLQRWKGSFNG